MALEREPHLVGSHSAPVVGYFDELEPARGKPDPDQARSGIERIFNEFLKSARRALDYLSCRNLIDELERQPSY
jgi:hypothetical protein